MIQETRSLTRCLINSIILRLFETAKNSRLINIYWNDKIIIVSKMKNNMQASKIKDKKQELEFFNKAY